MIRVEIYDYANDQCAHITFPGLEAIMTVHNISSDKKIGRHIYKWPSADEMFIIWGKMYLKSKVA